MSSAARAIGPAAMCARALRAAEGSAVFESVREELAGTLREEALKVLLHNGVPAQAREDLAQNVTLTVLARIVDGAVEPGFEDGYMAVAARNRARDWHRERSGVYEKTTGYEEEDLIAPGLDPHAALEQAEEECEGRALAERVVNVLRTAPPRYRDVLVAVYLEGIPIDHLVEQELFREWPFPPSGEDPIATRRRARARIDKLLQRARDWVRARILAARTTPPPPPPSKSRSEIPEVPR